MTGAGIDAGALAQVVLQLFDEGAHVAPSAPPGRRGVSPDIFMNAYIHDEPVLEPDLADPATARWPAFVGPAVTAGAHAVFGFPLRVGVVRLGAMDLFSGHAGALDDDHFANALVVADVAAETVPLLQAGAPPGEVARELAVGADFKYVVHQAAGMVAAQIDITVTHALLRLRAHAFGNKPAARRCRRRCRRARPFAQPDANESESRTAP